MTLSGGSRVSELVARIRKGGVALWEENGKLRYRAPQGLLDGSDLQLLKEYKADILGLLRTEAKQKSVVCRPEARYEPFPLTDVQSAYLLGRSEVFEYGGVACHIYLELNYPELAPARTEEVWNKIVLRHDMLRAVIDRSGYQQVLEKTPRLKVPYTDAADWADDKVAQKLDQIREEMGHRIYDTASWPLFGVAVTKTPGRSVLHFSIEFLIADWASIWRILAEFEALYDQPGLELPGLELSFRDYLLAERSVKESEAYAGDRNYWLGRIDDLPPAPELPLAPMKKDLQKPRFRRQYLQLAEPSWAEFKRKAQQRGLTPTSAVMAAYAAVLERWSRNKKFCLNLTVLNRLPLHEEVNDIVGDFTSVSLLAVDWNAGKSFSERAKQLSAQLFDDLDHPLFSGVEVIREITRRKGRDAALMPVVFTSAIGLTKITKVGGLRGVFEGQGISQTPQVFIDCQAMDGPAGLQVNWDFRDGIFPEGMMEDMFTAFEQALELLAGQNAAWELEDIVALPSWQLAQREQMNNTKAELPEELLHGKILRQAEFAPDKTAVVDHRGQATYRELMLSASAVAQKLTEYGCRPQDRVAVIMEKSVGQVAAVLGILSVGAVYVPLDPALPELRLASMLEQTGIRHVLTSSGVKRKWPNQALAIDVDMLQPCSQNTLQSTGNPALPAYIIHTSGSTGQPKGVVISHRAAVNTIADINRRFQVNSKDCILGLAQLSFDLSVYDIFGVLSAGGTLVYPSGELQNHPAHWVDLMEREEITLWNSVPALMQMLVACLESDRRKALNKLRLVLLSGDWIPLTLPEQVLKLAPFAQLVSLGGATEASIWSIFHLYQGLQPGWTSIPYGQPLANQSFAVLDKKLRDCPVWTAGELYIAGAGLAEGYFNDPATTGERFFDHPTQRRRLYRTGDLGRYTPGGEIEFLGRTDTQVKIRGYRIELGEIESALLNHSAVAAAAAVVDDSDGRQTLTAVVQARPAGKDAGAALAAELAEFLKNRLPAQMLPSRLHLLEELPLTGNGKLDRRKLTQWAAGENAKDCGGEKDDNKLDILEGQIARIWAKALSIPHLGRLQNFYDHGADSLIMAQVAGNLRDKLAESSTRTPIPFDALFRQMLNYPTVAALAEFIRTEERQTGRAAGGLPADESRNEAKDPASNAVLTMYGEESEGSLSVIFHAVLGTIDSFRALLKPLVRQKPGPVVAITIADIDRYCAIEPQHLIETVADDYAGRLLATGHKEMQLIGYSLGGLIATEVARRLLEKGIEVADLVLIDIPPTPAIEDDLLLEVMFISHLKLTPAQTGFGHVEQGDLVRGVLGLLARNNNCVPAGMARTIGGDQGLDQVGGLFRKLELSSRRERFASYVQAVYQATGEVMPVEMAESLFKVYCQSFKAAHFTPPPYMGDIRFLTAREPFGFLPGITEMTLDFWRDVCLGEFSVQEIAGDHLSCIADENNAAALAGVIREGVAGNRSVS